MTDNTYSVTGMTCGHCVQAVTEEVSTIPGVQDVEVNLEAGTLSFVSESTVPTEAVRAAVGEAGYALAG